MPPKQIKSVTTFITLYSYRARLVLNSIYIVCSVFIILWQTYPVLVDVYSIKKEKRKRQFNNVNEKPKKSESRRKNRDREKEKEEKQKDNEERIFLIQILTIRLMSRNV